MIKASHKKIWYSIISTYTKIGLKRCFAGRDHHIQCKISDKPILLISNHFCFWDGLIQLTQSRHIFKRRFYVMMLHSQLKLSPYLRKIGAFSVAKGSREIISSLDYSCSILENSSNMLLIFPQGRIESLYTHKFRFQKGLQYILDRKGESVQIIFNINLIDYGAGKRPFLTSYFGEYNSDKDLSLSSLEAEYNLFANECKIKQSQRWSI